MAKWEALALTVLLKTHWGHYREDGNLIFWSWLCWCHAAVIVSSLSFTVRGSQLAISNLEVDLVAIALALHCVWWCFDVKPTALSADTTLGKEVNDDDETIQARRKSLNMPTAIWSDLFSYAGWSTRRGSRGSPVHKEKVQLTPKSDSKKMVLVLCLCGCSCFVSAVSFLIEKVPCMRLAQCRLRFIEGVCSWPSVLRTVYGDQERYETTYFAPYPGMYFTGDGARRDKDGWVCIFITVMSITGQTFVNCIALSQKTDALRCSLWPFKRFHLRNSLGMRHAQCIGSWQ